MRIGGSRFFTKYYQVVQYLVLFTFGVLCPRLITIAYMKKKIFDTSALCAAGPHPFLTPRPSPLQK